MRILAPLPVDERTDELVLRCAHGDAQGQIDRFRLGQGITGAAAFHRKIYRFLTCSRIRAMYCDRIRCPIPIRKHIVIPIKENDLRGVINLKSRTLRRPAKAEVRILEDISLLSNAFKRGRRR